MDGEATQEQQEQQAVIGGTEPVAEASATEEAQPVTVAPTGEAAVGRLSIVASLREAVLLPEQRAVEVVCIQPGVSKNGNYYSRDVLGAMLPLFEGARAFADHPGPGERPERSVRDIVGYYKSPHLGAGGELRAVLKVSKNADWLWTLIEEALSEGQASLVGVSIDADARVSPGRMNGRDVRVVEAVTRLNSCDVVTRASAGGRFDRMVREADNGSWWDTYQPDNELAAQMQERSAAAGADMHVPVSQLQVPVRTDDGTLPPVQFGPSVAANIAGGQVIVGGTYVVEGEQGDMAKGTGTTVTEPGEENKTEATAGAGGGTHPTDARGPVTTQVQEGQGSQGGTPAPAVPATVAAAAAGASVPVSAPNVPPVVAEDLAQLRESYAGERAAMAQLREELARERRVIECERLLGSSLRGAGLPPAVAAKLERRFSGRVFEQAELDAELAEERAVLAELSGAGLIRGMGYEKEIRVGMSQAERLQKAFDQLFDISEGERVPALGGIKEAYVVVTGDHEISGVSAPERVRESDVTTASFSYLLGTSMNKRLLKDYQAWPSEWQKFCTITPIKDFKQQDRIRLGAFGSLSTVPEDTAYTTLTLSDTRATYTPTKRGNIIAVTRETIINDDLYSIKQIPGKLAVAAAFTLAEFVYGFLTSTGNIYDGNPLFQKNTGHTNSAVSTPGTPNTGAALASGAMQTGVTAMRRQTNLAGKPIGLKPRFLVVPPELEWTAMVLTKSAGAPGVNYNDINPMLGYTEVIVTPQYSSATMWNLIADPRVVDTIEVGFVGGQVNPVLFVQDQPLFGNNFTNDVITYKVRHEYGGAVVDYRGFYQGNN